MSTCRAMPSLRPQCGGVRRNAASYRMLHSLLSVSRTTHVTAAIDSHLPELDKSLDNDLSLRPLTLDDCGYFIIRIDPEERFIIAEHYGNVINEHGLACDEETGEVISCGGESKKKPVRVFTGRSAKELSVKVLEEESGLCSRLEHANYLGRELQKAEYALLHSLEYIQD